MQASGEKLKKLRGNTSIEKVARDLGISNSALIKYENNERTPRDEVKVKIAKYYNTSVESIFFAD